MFAMLLAIIYVSFISLGLPDSLLGSAWPVMQPELGVPVSYAGLITMVISFGTIVSSLMSDRLNRRLGTGLVTAISVLMTAIALFGFSVSDSFFMLCIWSIPYGLGAGAVDAALNNFVALHYTSRHMNWLHCFWGVGAAISPYIMGACLSNGSGWHSGYLTVSIIQIILSACIFISIPLWKRKSRENSESNEVAAKAVSLKQALKIKGVPAVLITFFAYCAIEQTTGLWASSYLVQNREIGVETASSFASLFFLGITFGRFLCGFISDKIGDKTLVRIGILTSISGTILVALPLESDLFALGGLIIIGFGCAPIYPSIIHSTPSNFGKENSQAIIGIQMASAYVGTTFMPPLFGVIASLIDIAIYPFYLLLFATILLIMSERVNRIIAVKNNKN